MSESENLTAQVQEIEALCAVYHDEFKTDDEAFRTYSATVTEGGHNATLIITLPPDYPSQSPPYYLLTAPWMKAEDKDVLYNGLEEIYTKNSGECILHLWIEKLREHLRDVIPSMTSNSQTNTGPVLAQKPAKHVVAAEDCNSLDACPPIISTEPFTERKSTFQGHAARVQSVKEVKVVLAKLCENRKIEQATHNMYAYRIYDESKRVWLQDCEDDGEDLAGGRMLHLLQILDARNVVVVVSRWFGGILLGGDRFKLINNAAKDALQSGGFLAKTSGAGDGSASTDPTFPKKKHK